MKESLIDADRAVIANHQPTIVAEPGEGALHDPATTVAAQRLAILGTWFASIPAVRGDQFDASGCQLRAQRIAVIPAVANDTGRFLAGPSTATPVCYADRGDRFFGEPGFVRGSRVKLLSQKPPFSPERNCRRGTIRSSPVAHVRSVPPKKRAKW